MSNVLDIIGSGNVRQGTPKSWAYTEGETEIQTYRGDKITMQSLYETLKSVAGFNPTWDGVSFDPGKGVATVSVKLVGDGATLYELSANEISASIATHKYFDSLTDDQVTDVYLAAQTYDKSMYAGFSSIQKKLYARLIRGIEEYPTSQYVLRETKTVSKRSTVQASFINDNVVDTPPNTSTVNTLIGSLPTGEWIKKSPIVRQIGSRKFQIITEWWWTRLADAILYGGTYLP